jgi:putative glutamine amidotransferase
MGSVYEAEDVASGRRVALKLIPPEFASPAAVERFRQEGRLASGIAHPRCVFVLAADEDAGRPYIVMELMPGLTLDDLVRERGPLPPAEAIAKVLDVIDGLVLAGGADVDPAAYGSERDPHTIGTVPERDAFEIALALRALERDMPLLGICRGMQVMNVARGGTLIQHLPDDKGHEDHRRALGTFENADHDVRLESDSLIMRITGERLHGTKSHHHQGVDEIGDGFEVTGWATVDDLPEVIEDPCRRFVLGVQWHPEVDPASPLIAGLVEEARAYRDERRGSLR